MTIRKIAEIKLKAGPYGRSEAMGSGFKFYSYDKDSAAIDFYFRNQDGSPTDILNCKTELMLLIKEDDEQKKITVIDSEVEIISALKGHARYVIPDRLRGYVGLVQGYVYLNFPDKSRTDECRFDFTIERSLIEEEFEDGGDYYIKDIQVIFDEVKDALNSKIPEMQTEYDNLVKTFTDYANEKIAEYDSRFVTLNSNLLTLQNSLTTAQNKVTTLEQSITTANTNLNARIDEISKKIDDNDVFTKTDASKFRADIDTLVMDKADKTALAKTDAEVAVARGGFNTLDERLTTKEQEVNAQLAHTAKQTKKQSFLFGPKTFIIGHRGCSMYAPENSKKSFELAYFNGMAGIETDLRSTADGHIICYHDATLDTKTNGTGKPEEVTLEYIQSLKLTKANGYDAYPNTGIATFDEYLDVAKKYNLIIFPEIAVQTEAQVYEITDKIIAHGLQNQCVVLVNRWNYSLVKTHAPNLIQCLIPSWGVANTADIDFCATNNIEICGVAFSVGVNAIPQSFIDYANEKGVYLNGYIINTASDFIRIKNLGFKFISTDVFGEVR